MLFLPVTLPRGTASTCLHHRLCLGLRMSRPRQSSYQSWRTPSVCAMRHSNRLRRRRRSDKGRRTMGPLTHYVRSLTLSAGARVLRAGWWCVRCLCWGSLALGGLRRTFATDRGSASVRVKIDRQFAGPCHSGAVRRCRCRRCMSCRGQCGGRHAFTGQRARAATGACHAGVLV